MKQVYTTPEIEIIEFEDEACITMSGNGEENPQDSDNFVDFGGTGWGE